MANTPVLGLPYPTPDDTVDVPRDVQALAQALDTLVYIVGELRAFGLADPPPKWIPCDNRVLTTLAYPELSAAMGVRWNIGGEAAGSFRVPDLAGRALVGAGAGTGLVARAVATKWGVEAVILSTAQLPAHAHGITDPGHAHSGATGGSGSTLNHSHNSVFNTLLVAGSAGGTPAFVRDAWQAPVNHVSEGASINLDHVHPFTTGYNGSGVSVNSNGGGGNHDNTQPSTAALICVYAGR